MESDIEIEENKFNEWLKLNYPNRITQYNYLETEKRFKKKIGTNILNQASIETWMYFANKKGNPLNMAFIKNYLECYDPERTSGLKITKSRSKRYKPTGKDRFLDKEEIDLLIEKLPKPLGLIVKVLFETGLRKQELLNVRRKDIDFDKRTIKGLGKGNKAFSVHFSPVTAELLKQYCQEQELMADDYLFIFCKRFHPEFPYVNQAWAFWYVLRTESLKLGLDKMFVHKIRFSLGRYLRSVKKFDIEQVRVKLRHENLNTTQRYSEATKEEVEKLEDAEVFT